MIKTILITGGIGYVGANISVELLQNNFEVIIINRGIDPKKLAEIETLTNKKPLFYDFDLQDKTKLDQVFHDNKIDAVIHLASLKAVGESVENPLTYYQNNLISTMNLLEVMIKHNCKQIIFASSATVYGLPQYLPIDEKHSLSALNPYGQTKIIQEDILRDVFESDKTWKIAALRYANPVGAHQSGLLAEVVKGVPPNLFPRIVYGIKNSAELTIFGDDYDTRDGTSVRDYVHVSDLALAHLKVLQNMEKSSGGFEVYNLGTGTGFSILEVIKEFERQGLKVPYKTVTRRVGDAPEVYLDPSKANKELNWQAQKTLSEMVADSWRPFENK
jgi:UDP-glucose 4-epimerase